MSGFIKGEDRYQATLFPERLDDYIAEDSAVRVIDVFLDDLDLSGLGFQTEPNDTGRPPYHPSTMLKIYVYGYLNRVQSSRRLETEAQRNIELMWLTERLAPDFKTIADFRKDNGEAIRLVCREFVMLCRKLNLFANAFSWCCAASSTCLPTPSWRLMAVSSRPLTIAIATSPRPR
jgi:transposase